MDKVREQSHLLCMLCDPNVKSSVKTSLCLNGPNALILVLCSCGVNILCGNCPLTAEQLKNLKAIRKFIYQLAETNETVQEKRQILAKEVKKRNSGLNHILPIVLEFVHDVYE